MEGGGSFSCGLVLMKTKSGCKFVSNMAATEEVSMIAAIVTVSSEVNNISSLKAKQRTVMKALLDGKDVFILFPTDFSKSNECETEHSFNHLPIFF